TGNSALGGDWSLEESTGEIEATLAFRSDVLESYQEIFQIFTATNVGELIASITTANVNGEADTIRLTPNGTYTLTAVDNVTDGANGLPSILADGGNSLTIEGFGSTIERGAAAPNFRIFHVQGGADLQLSDVTLSNGSTQTVGGFRERSGGAIFNKGTLRATNSTISGNTANANGGGIFSDSATAVTTITNSTISGNTANSGGGIYSYGTTTITNSTLSGNTATNTGGGIYNRDTVIITDSTISGNSANGNGGGGIKNYGTATITNSTISGNTANAGSGGGIYNYGAIGSITTITNSTISGNTANTRGGGIDNFGVEVRVSNSTISDNTSNAKGGGMYNYGTATVSNSTISGNTSNTSGGGIYNYGTATVSNSTIFNNTAASGGGIYNDGFGPGAVTNLDNSIIAGNTAITADPDVGRNTPANNTFNDSGNNLIGEDTLGVFTNSTLVGTTGNPLDPRLAPLGNYGGTTQTNALLPDSRALDAGSNALVPGGINTDQRGAARIANGTVDIGAFESQGFSLTPIAGTPQSTTVDTTFSTNLQVQLTENFANSPIPNVTIAFAPPSGGASGSFSSANTAITDASGIATANLFTANTIAGNYQVAASTTNVTPASFNLTNTPDSPSRLQLLGGDNQTTLILTPFTNDLSLQVFDQFDNPVSNVAITFTAPGTGASGAFGSSNFTTNASGIVSTSFSANEFAGSYQVTAGVSGVDPITFNLANTSLAIITPFIINPVDLTQLATISTDTPVIYFIGESSNLIVDPIFAEIEVQFTQEFENYFGFSDSSTTTGDLSSDSTTAVGFSSSSGSSETVSLEQVQKALQDLESATGIKPAIIYAIFIPSTTSPPPDSNNEKSETAFARNAINPPQTLWQFNEQGLSSTPEAQLAANSSAVQPTDLLELVLVTSSGQPIRHSVRVTRAEVETVTNRFRRSVTNVRRRGAYRNPAQQMYQWLIAPLEEDLKEQDISNLVFVMDADLRSIPLAALHDGDNFIVENYSIGLMPSLSLSDTSYRDLRGTSMLAMGADTFDTQNSLPAVPVELEILTEQLWRGNAFLNEDFTLNNLKAARAQNPYGIIHLATHGEFKSGKPSNSYIQLDDTQLTLDQLRTLGWHDPPVELLVLSACRTALGDVEAELGFAGLAVAAGVKTALGSLWYVSDGGTLGLMTTFYEQLQEVPIKAEALRLAQLAMIEGEVQIENGQLITPTQSFPLPPTLVSSEGVDLSHPYYWSAFTMIGNPW
ncbi:CHAT domain-containing protein, partial [Lusitaniella coriacea LEGE 07157]